FAAARKLLRGGPLWLNVQDIPSAAAAASGISQSQVFDRWATFVQSWLFNRAEVWSTISPLMLTELGRFRRSNQPLHLCPNWLNESMANCIRLQPSKQGRPAAKPLRLLYAGNIGKKQGLLPLCEKLAAHYGSFELRIHGDGGEAHTVRQWVKSSGDARF